MPCLQVGGGQKVHAMTAGHFSRLSAVTAASVPMEAPMATTATVTAEAGAGGAIAPEALQKSNGYALASATYSDDFTNKVTV